ncbi:MAG: hypothetical protein VB859_05195, partial [Planctomycetaceae bacterium]
MNRSRLLVLLSIAVLGFSAAFPQPVPAAAPDQAARLLEQSGIQGGLIVHLGCQDGTLTAALRINGRYQVHGLDRNFAMIQATRSRLLAQDVYGKVTASRLVGNELPLIDGLVNLLLVEDSQGIGRPEMLRVLAPGGVLLTKTPTGWNRHIRQRPADIDDWTHYLHDASGNAVAHDSQVGPPRHLQWIGGPRWSRHHDRMASMSA